MTKMPYFLLCICGSAIYCAFSITNSPPPTPSEKQTWTFLSGKWQERGNQLEGESTGHGFAIMGASRYAREQTLEVTVTPQRRVSGQSWSAGGLCLFQDATNFWRLSLVEGPNGERYAELLENHHGVWQAQNEGTTALRVTASEGRDLNWKFGTPSRLRLTVTRKDITGEVLDAQGERLSRFAYAFDAAPAVRSGWLAVNVQDMAARFEGAVQHAPKEAQQTINFKKVALVRDAAMGEAAIADILNDALMQSGLEVASASLTDLTQEQWWQQTGAGVLALPDARRLPVAAKEPLLDFLRRGGKLICVGVPLFGEPLFRVKNSWLTANALAARRREVAAQHQTGRDAPPPLFDVASEDLTRWQRASNNLSAPSKLSVEQTDKGKALRVDVRSLSGWDNFSRTFTTSPYAQGNTLTCFWAKGQRRSDVLSVEWQERDGSRWIATVPITSEWRYYVLTPQDFTYWQDNPAHGKRGGAGDRFQLQNAAKLSLGFAFSHQATGGDHTVWIADMSTAPDPFGAVDTTFEPPRLEGLSPGYKLYPLRGVTKVWARHALSGAAATLMGTPREGWAPVPRHDGAGGDGRRPYRLVRLGFSAETERGGKGELIWLVLHHGLPYAGAGWLCVGTTDEDFWARNKGRLIAVLGDALREWFGEGIWLCEAGADRFTAYTGENIPLSARVANFSPFEQEVEVQLRITRQGAAQPLRTLSRTLRLPPRTRASAQWTVESLAEGTYSIWADLRHPRTRLGDPPYSLSHSLHIISPPRVTAADRVTVRDGHFVLNGERWFAMGVNFWPRYAIGLEPGDYWVHWLDPRYYDPHVVEQDLNIVKSLGMNCVSIQYNSVEQALPLRDFLRRCHQKRIKVNVFLPGAHPLHFDPDLVKRLIEAADLANQPAMFAYDVAWEPTWGRYEQRKNYDAVWRAWLTKRYGSIERAEEAWNFKAPRNEKGEVTGPTDEQVTSDGAWRKMVADYRRFQDDHLRDGYAKVRQHIKSLDPNHLIGVRTGWGGGPFINSPAMPFDHASGVEHLDFVSPEGWNLSGAWESIERGAFITAYARAVSGGKPVFWAEFGFNVGYPLPGITGVTDDAARNTQDVLQQQAQHYENIYRLMEISDADGAMGWWFPGGYRVDEKSDYGLINPDGTPRPACDVVRRYAQTFANIPPTPAPEVWMEIDRFADARGAWALWQKHADEFVRLMREGKRVGLKLRQ
ncbi:MAG: beta-galactosidase [Abditibacteriales bacterium]|nr:beta-galactosidase [Abditibacteriales bacterium]MDW8366222.1 beta-galactosidase [Abditibacteriales bacterium]